MKCKYVVYGCNKHNGPKMYGISKQKTKDRGFEVAVWVCNVNGDPVSDDIEWEDGLTWWRANTLFWQYYLEYDKYVNRRV